METTTAMGSRALRQPADAPTDRRSDAAAFTRLRPTLRRLLLALGLPATDVDDCLQDTFVTLTETTTIFTDATHRDRWLTRIAVNRARLHFRQNHRRQRKAANLKIIRERDAADSGAGANIGSAEEKARVQAALQQLPIEDRAMLIMKYFMEWPVADIAATFDKPTGTIRRRLCEARQALADVLKAENAE